MPLDSSGDSSASPDDESMRLNDEYSDLSELSLPAAFDGQDERRAAIEEAEITDQAGTARIPTPVVSVVVHLELQDAWCFGLPGANDDDAGGAKMQLQWSCKEPAEVGRPPTFELKASNGWEACYEPATGVLTAATPEGDPLRYEILGVSGARSGSNAASGSSRASTAWFAQRTFLPPLVRFCQCLALRTMQLRGLALRGQASKLPFVHYDTLPESLLASFRYRAKLLSAPQQATALKDGGGESRLSRDASVASSSTQADREITIAGVGRGLIAPSGDLRVAYLDGSQLTLAASGLQLRFRPTWADSDDEDVFELLTTSSMSAFLPSAVKHKLESIPEFIRRLKAAS
jgi:hypothetical protein